MDTYYLSTPQLLGIEAEVTGSEYTFIQRGLNFLLHGNGTEGILLLAQAHAQLTAKKSQLVGLLEAAINACAKLDQAQEALLDASRDYAKAEAEREAQLSSLACVLGAQNVQNSILPSPIDLLHHRSDDRRDDQGYSPTIGAITGPLPLSSSKASSNDLLPALSIACFGRFIVRRGGQVLELCRSRNGQAILRYLVAQPGYRASADALMEAFWAGEEPDIARRKLQVAVSALRCSLNQGCACDPGGGYITCKNQLYQLNPSVTLLTDLDEFLALYQTGRHGSWSETINSYERACRLYNGPFLAEDLYADWSIRRREQLSQIYLFMCVALSNYFLETGKYEEVAHWASATLNEKRCDEEAHRQLMRAYAAQGRRSDALRQYHYCEQVLLEELSVAPMLETV